MVTLFYLGMAVCAFFLMAYCLDIFSVSPPTELAGAQSWEEEWSDSGSQAAVSSPREAANGAGALAAETDGKASSAPSKAETASSAPSKTEAASSAPSKTEAASSAPAMGGAASSEPAPPIAAEKAPPRPAPSRPAPSADAPLDLNTATEADLCALHGIGPVLAKRIIEFRESCGGFASVEELLEVSGIGEKKLAAIRDFVMVN